MNYKIREMTLADYDAVLELWKKTEHLGLNECDTRGGIELYLARNPGLSFIAEEGGAIIGAVLCGHDGRRGFLRHLAVAKDLRSTGVGRSLVEAVLEELAAQGLGKCNIFVANDNQAGFGFWKHMGWTMLDDTFRTLQKPTRLLDPKP